MTPPGSRWITVHPAGDEHEGRPVLIKDDGSGTVLGGMGGQFNGQKLGALYRSGDGRQATGDSEKKPEADKTPEPAKEHPKPEQPAAQKPDAEREPSSHEAHARYNPHLPDYEDLGPELQAAVHGVPTHAGEGRGWAFHLRNPHLEAMSSQGYGALPGGLLLPHPAGGVVYHQHGTEHTGPDDYESALHSMATDVAGQVHEHLGREHERRMRDDEDKTYHEETQRELAAWQRTQYADVRKAIAGFGGIARFKDKDAKGRRYMDAEYDDYVPRWARNQSGLTPDRARAALNEAFPHLGLETPNDLFDYLDKFEDERAAFKDEQGQARRERATLAAQKKAEREQARAAKDVPHHDPEFERYAGIVLRRVWSAPVGSMSRRALTKDYGPEMVGHLLGEGLLREEKGALAITAAGRPVGNGKEPVPPRRGPQQDYVLPSDRPNVPPSYDPLSSHTRRYAERMDAHADVQNYFEGQDMARGKWDRTVKPTTKYHEYEDGTRVTSHHWDGQAVTLRERPNGKVEAHFPAPNPYGGDLGEHQTEGTARRRANRQAETADEEHGQIAYPRGTQKTGGLPQLLDHPAAQQEALRAGMRDREGTPYHPSTHVVVQPYANQRMGFLLPSHVVPREDKHEEFDVPAHYEIPEDVDKARRKVTERRKKEAAMARRPAREAGEAGMDAEERMVRESTVQPPSVRANITREGRGWRIRDCQIMQAGPGNQLMANTYEPEAIEALVREVQRQPKSFVDHDRPSETRERGHRSLKDLAGVYDKRTVRYDPDTQACLADLIVRPTVYDEYVAPVLEAGDNLGISVDGVGHCPEKPRHVKGWRRFNSADLVPAGGARGMIVREADSAAEKAAERQFAMSLFDEVSSADVRESAPALFEQIGREYAAAQATGDRRQATETPPAASAPVREEPPQNARLAALETRVREAEERAQAADARVYELEAEGNKRAVAAFVDAVVRECGLTEDKQVAFVAQHFTGATMGPEGTYQDQASLEATVRERAEEFKAVLPPAQTASWGQITGMGRGNGTPGASRFATPEKQNKVVVDAVDWLFGAPSTATQSHEGAPNGAQAGAGS